MKKILLFTLLTVFGFAAQLKVAAAANLSFVLNEIKDGSVNDRHEEPET